MRTPRRILVALTGTSAVCVAMTACGAGSRVASQTATEVSCTFPAPKRSTDVNVLAYNSSAIDPFTNTMVKSCSKGKMKVNHEPIDFGGQVQKTTATLAGKTGSYDIVETYSFVVPQLAAKGKLVALDELMLEKERDYGLGDINAEMREAMSYDGKLYALPMQAQMYVMAYRKDVFDKLGIQPPKTFADLAAASRKIQEDGGIKHPLALPLLASADIVTAYDAALGSLGENLTDGKTKKANLDSPQSKEALKELIALKPYMDPQVTTFDQPAVQQQLYNGKAAIAIMFSGRMNDLTLDSNTRYAKDFGFAPPPSVKGGKVLYNVLSVDGWSIPKNAKTDPDTLFSMIASSVSGKASKASLPAAYPARNGMVRPGSSRFADAATESIKHAPPAEPYPWTSEISVAITPTLADILLEKTSVDDGAKKMQDQADRILDDYR